MEAEQDRHTDKQTDVFRRGLLKLCSKIMILAGGLFVLLLCVVLVKLLCRANKQSNKFSCCEDHDFHLVGSHSVSLATLTRSGIFEKTSDVLSGQLFP